MHVRWRGLELPGRVTADKSSLSQTFGRFSAEPFERGFGTTIGNSMRRILLSSIEGAAITKLQIAGVTHEFTSIPGIVQDVSDIVLNIKGLIVEMDGEESKTVRIRVEGPCDVTGASIESDASIRILNPDHLICRVNDKVRFEADLTVMRGRGYQPASEQYNNIEIEQVIGEIPVDAIFTPVQRVRYRVEDTRVGQRMNYERLVLDVWTNGTVSPEMAVVEAGKILRKHVNPFVQFDSAGDELVEQGLTLEQDVDADLVRKLEITLSELNLGVRATNCLQAAGIVTVRQLVQKTEGDLMELRAFGKTSLQEITARLQDLGLSLGMQAQERSSAHG
ncbi:MAG: DNA-directed RNA polymerase subunit alpha [Phycisphaerales bacterium]|nr:DNA-directed RNA polymerase subunit alpha [Phycisphaerales bacterium]